jgi:Arc/MetJ-type ribon-helix-helix transcriptional regulator
MPAEVTPTQQQIVSELVSSGKYPNDQAVLDEALELLQQRDKLRDLLQDGIDDLDEGNRVPAAEAMNRLRSGLAPSE